MSQPKTDEQTEADAARKEEFKYEKRAKDELCYGYEIPDPEPVAPPVGYVPTPPIEELIRQMVTSHMLRAEAAQQGFETFEESDDFEVGDEEENEPYSEYELKELGPIVKPPSDEELLGKIKELQSELDKRKEPSPTPPETQRQVEQTPIAKSG